MGNPDGLPVLFLHGGPGVRTGCIGGCLILLVHRVILMDQRVQPS